MAKVTLELNAGSRTEVTVKDLQNALLRAQRAENATLKPGDSIKVKGVRIRVATPDLNEVRKWALEQGIKVGARGKVSKDLQAQFDAAHA